MRRTVMLKLSAILMGIVVTLLFFSFYFFYHLVIEWNKEHLREMVQSQARLIEESFRSDREHYVHHSKLSDKEAFANTLGRLRNAHNRYEGFGESGEYTLAMQEEDMIHFLLSHRHDKVKVQEKVIPVQKGIAEPMQLALAGKSGTIVGGDYQGVAVIAAFEPLNTYIPMGIVAKIDLAEVQKPLIYIGMTILAVSLFLVLAGVGLIFRVTDPLVRRLKKSENYYETLLNTVPDIVTEMDRDKRILWSNAAGRLFYGNGVVGKVIKEFFVGEQDTHKRVDVLLDGSAQCVSMESLQRRQDGEARLLDWQCCAVADETGQVVSILSGARDVTEQQVEYKKIQKFNRVLKVISECNQIVVRAQDEGWLLEQTARVLHKEGGFNGVFFVRDEAGIFNMLVSEGSCDASVMTKYLELPESKQEQFPVRKVLQEFEPSIRQKVESALMGDLCPAGRDTACYSVGVFPMVMGAHAGVLILCSDRGDVFDDVETRMIYELVGDLEYGTAAIENIRKIEQANKQMEKLHRRYSIVSDVAKVGAWELWPEEEKLFADDGFKRLIGYAPEEVGDDFKEWMALFHEDDREKLRMVLEKMAAEDYDKQTIESRFRQKDGSFRWFLISGSRVDMQEGGWRVYGAATDINDQIRAYEALARKNEQFYNTIEDAPIPMMLHTEDGEVLRINRAWSDLTGYSKSMIPTIDAWTKKAYGEEHEQAKKAVADLFKGDGKFPGGQFRVTTLNGQKLIWYLTASVIGESSDGRRVAIAAAVDMTELNQKEEQMIAQSRQAAMGDMIAMIAHQWRQPITVIAMAANNISLDIELGDSVTEEKLLQMLETVSAQTQHLSKTIDDFRNFFKPNKEKESVTIGSVVTGAMKIIGKSLENNNISVTVNDDSKQQFETYPNELLQVFLNIIGNAKDALKTNEREDAAIHIECKDVSEGVVLEICDNAGGIPEPVMAKIGQPYFTTKKISGTGLGIYMSKTIIEKHLDGSIDWVNRDGGACFSIRLPLAFEKDAS